MLKLKKGQATIEYILLIALIVFVFFKGFRHVRDVFFGWESEPGAIELMVKANVAENFSTLDPPEGF